MRTEKQIGGRWFFRDSEAKDFQGKPSQAWFPFSKAECWRKITEDKVVIAALADSLTELLGSPNAKANNMWDRARAALQLAKDGGYDESN